MGWVGCLKCPPKYTCLTTQAVGIGQTSRTRGTGNGNCTRWAIGPKLNKNKLSVILRGEVGSQENWEGNLAGNLGRVGERATGGSSLPKGKVWAKEPEQVRGGGGVCGVGHCHHWEGKVLGLGWAKVWAQGAGSPGL